MTVQFPIPTDKESILNQSGHVNPTWYKFFRQLRADASTTSTANAIPRPEDYGAVGDGVTDDTQAMVDFFANTSKFGMLTSGATYLVSMDTVTVPANTEFWGDKTAIIKNADLDGITLGITESNVTLRGFTIDGGNSSSTIAAGYVAGHRGISAYGADKDNYISDIVLDQLTIKNCGEQGIEAVFVNRIKVTNCHVSRCGLDGIGFWSVSFGLIDSNRVTNIYPGEIPGDLLSNSYGIVLSSYDADVNPGCEFIMVSHNDVDLSMWEGIDEHNSTDIWFVNNRVTNCGTGISCEHHVSSRPARRIFIKGNSITGFGTTYTIEGVAYEMIAGIIAKGGDDNDAVNYGQGLVIADNYVASSGDTRSSHGIGGGITIRNFRGVHVTSNYLFSCYKHGIICASGTDSVTCGTITGNSIDGTQTIGGVARDIYVDSKVALQVTGNFAQGNGDGFSQVGGPTYVTTFSNNYLYS